MQTLLIITIAIISTLTLIILARKVFILSKRSIREKELKLAIGRILDPSGSRSAVKVEYPLCVHLVEHYGIKLVDCGFDDLESLFIEAGRSLRRAEEREERTLKSWPFKPTL